LKIQRSTAKNELNAQVASMHLVKKMKMTQVEEAAELALIALAHVRSLVFLWSQWIAQVSYPSQIGPISPHRWATPLA
jgi:hypothetical protein